VLGALVIAGVAPFEAGGLDFLAGMGQDNIDEFGASIESPEVLRAYLSNARDELADLTVESLIASMDSLLPEVDRVVLTEEFGANMVASVVEGLRLGYEGWFEDDLAFVAPWGFDLDEISIPTAIWQGSEDLMVPFAHGEWLASHVPDTSAHLLEGEGHLSVGIGAMDQMVEELLSFAAN
jgi:pimeloyl-ACP methyl ester carboxylesterase